MSTQSVKILPKMTTALGTLTSGNMDHGLNAVLLVGEVREIRLSLWENKR